MLKTIFIRSDADVGDLGEDAAGDAQRRGAERLADGEADEAGAGVVARDEEQDEQHDQQLDADQQHADAHAGLERNRVDRVRLALEAGERRARVGVGVHADAEPRHAVAAEDADDAEEQDDADAQRLQPDSTPKYSTMTTAMKISRMARNLPCVIR